MRQVRWLDDVAADITRALPDPEDAARFATIDLSAAVRALARPGFYEKLDLGPWPGRRLVVAPGRTVGAYMLFVALDMDDTLVVFGIAIWPSGFR